MEIVDSDTQQMDGSNHNPQHQQAKRDFDPYGGGAAGGNNKINDSIMVPSDAVGMIIGKGKFQTCHGRNKC